MKRYVSSIFIFLLLMFAVSVGNIYADTVDFSWCQEPDTNSAITGYRLYYGEENSNDYIAVTLPDSPAAIPVDFQPTCPPDDNVAYDTYYHTVTSPELDTAEFFSLTAVNGEGGESSRSDEIEISLPPVVGEETPVDGASEILVESFMTVTFNEDMDPNTITDTSFTLKDSEGLISGTVSYSARTATFTPNKYLKSSVVYTAEITTAVTDAGGVALATPHSWTFTSEGAPEVNASSTNLAEVLEKASYGTLIRLKGNNNVYTGDITLKDGVSITGTNPDNFTIDGTVTVNGKSDVSLLTITTGGLEITDTAVTTIKNCIIRGNATGISLASSQAKIESNTIVNNTAGGIDVSSTNSDGIKIINNIISGNDSGIASFVDITISYNNIAGNGTDFVGSNITSNEQVTSDPVFDDGGFHASYASPTIDAGDPDVPYDGEPSPNGSRINMGAFGNTSWATTTDTTPPYFVNSDPFNSTVKTLSLFTVTMSDAESGVDEAGSTISIAYNGSSFDDVYNGTYQRDNLENGQVILSSFSEPLEDGEYVITVTPIDRRGITGNPVTITIIQDSSVPTLTLAPVIVLTNSTSQTISGTVQQGAIVTISINGMKSEADYPTSTTWEFTLDNLLEGVNSITVTAGGGAVQTTEIFSDTIPPKKIADLTFSLSLTDITLGWTSTSDQGKTGRPSGYDLRYTTKPTAEIGSLDYNTKQITEEAWDDAIQVPIDVSPQSPDTEENVTVSGIIKEADISYFFAMKTIDGAGNVSDMSNEVKIRFNSAGSDPAGKAAATGGESGGSGCFISMVK